MGNKQFWQLLFAKTKKTANFILLISNLVFVAFGLALALWSIKLTAGGDKMSPAELSTLTSWINEYFVIVWVLVSIDLAFIGLFIIQTIITIQGFMNAKRESKKEDEIRAIAYDIWQREGCQDGHSSEYWSKARAIWEESKKKRA
jgi:hypothetical protein